MMAQHLARGVRCFWRAAAGAGGPAEEWAFLRAAQRGDLALPGSKAEAGGGDGAKGPGTPPSSHLPSYFEVFDVDAREYDVNLPELERKYKTLQKVLHPDKVASAAGGDRERASRREMGEVYSAHVNDGYAILRSPLMRANYMLQQRGICIDEASGMDDLDFLQTIMETREKLEGDLGQEELLALEGEINAKIDELVAGIGALLREDSLGQAKDLTAKLKYYDNILKEIIRQK
mmetsp:Transcript_12591/g.28615  ORF Transcript_12591/g.28615 Transcript_12591/m.28615 type:complete len:233 (-) Transcript_12591:57-755(-)